MNLFKVLLDLENFPEDHTIYAELPWTLESETIVVSEPDSGSVTLNIKDISYSYFLEVYIAEVLLISLTKTNLCLRESCQKVIEYAINDA